MRTTFCNPGAKPSVLSTSVRYSALSHLKSMFSMLTDYSAPRNEIENVPDFRLSRFDVASVVRPQLDNLIESREPSLSAEYHFLAGEYERVVTLLEKKNVKRLSPKDAETYGWSR